MTYQRFATTTLLCLLSILSWAANAPDTLFIMPDSNRVRNIDEVVVTQKSQRSMTRATAPLQVMSSVDLQKLNSMQISDAVKHFSGVTVKDYGGIGGLKTVSVRSLGASHTAVSYDGITLSDAQNGQIDIGRISTDNIDVMSLSNGQSDKIFQPARQFASAALLTIQSLAPEFTGKQPVKGKVSMKAGSWGLANPSLFIAARLNEKLALSVSGEYLYANGSYPYVMHYGDDNDSTSIERRENSDVQNIRAEATLYGEDSVQSGNAKIYIYDSKRGLPGATIFYNTQNFSSQRINDCNIFAQGHYKRTLNRRWMLQLNAKYNYAYTHYIDPMYLGSSGKEENRYWQNEYYASIAANYRPIDNLSFSLASDIAISTLTTDTKDFANPVRYNWLNAMAGKYVNRWVTATASVLLTSVWETVASGNAAKNRFKASPYISASFKPFENIDLRLRVFYKNIFRLPTFNDLYYGRVGNIDLKPETTNQYNIGATYQTRITKYIPLLSLSCDVYHNDVRDKIVAYPTKNIYTWTMLNYGLVSISGIDFSGELQIQPHEYVSILLGATYTYNRALNVTDPTARDYRHQIPYTPRISGSGNASLDTKWFTINYSLIWSGHRYAVNQNYTENRVEGFFDHSLSASHTLKIKTHELGINLECLNITNKNYAVVRYFPMPGRSWRGTIHWKF